MQKIRLGQNGPEASRIVQGCMRFNEVPQDQVNQAVAKGIENGINMFDNADIYGAGEGEKMCGKALKEVGIPREEVILQTKCGIENHMYDFSKEHILKAVDDSLKRLQTEYVDVLLLHRPDALMQPEEVAEALWQLRADEKVKHFGVSNMNPMQIKLLQKAVGAPFIANQLQLSPVHTGMIDAGILVNTNFPGSVMHDGSILDYCRLKEITIQAWSPYQKGHMEGCFLGDPDFPELNETINRLAGEKGTNPNAIVAAWLMRHPARIQVVIGTTNPERVAGTCEASDIEITHDEWYALYMAAGHKVP